MEINLKITGSNLDISDGYHTFDELYEHRNLLFLAFIRSHIGGWKSRVHNDGTSYPGYFIVGCKIDGKQITYHLPDNLWEYTNSIHEFDVAPEWDGHTSADVIDRLKEYLES